MRNFSLVVVAAALSASPAMAQLGTNVGVGANVGGSVSTGGLVNGVANGLNRTVNTVDNVVNRTANRAIKNSNLKLATRADVRTGLAVRDSRGQRVGTVQSVHGNTAVVVQGNRAMHVPITSLYRSSKGLVTNLTRTNFQASATTHASAKR